MAVIQGHRRFFLPLLGIALFGLFCLAPLFHLLVSALFLMAEGTLSWTLAVPTGRSLSILLRSVLLSGISAFLAILISMILVSYGWRWSSSSLYRWRWSVAALALVPPVVHGFLMSSLVIFVNGMIGNLGYRPWSSSGFWIAVAAEVTWFLPFALSIVSVSTASIDVQYVEAARLLSPDAQAVRRVLLPFARPMIVAGAGLLFVMGLTDYTIPSLFQVNVFSLEIFSEFSATSLPEGAFLLSMPSLVLCSALMAWIARTADSQPLRQASPGWETRPHWPGWLMGIQVATWAGFVGYLMFSASILWSDAQGASGLRTVIGTAWTDLTYSAVVALLGACLGVLSAYGVALYLLNKNRLSWMTWWLLFLPVAVPSPLVGIGLIGFWNRPGLAVLYETAVMPALAGTVRAFPWAAVLLLLIMRRTDPGLLEAAALLSGSHWRTFIQIRLPLLAPGFVASFVLIFVSGIGELGATLLVLPPGRSTLTVRLYNYLHYGAAEMVAGLTLVTVLLSAGAGFVLVVLLLQWGKFNAERVSNHD